MSSTDVFYAIDNFLQWVYQFFDWVGNKFNYLLLALGFFGFAFWMYHQWKFNQKAANDPKQIK